MVLSDQFFGHDLYLEVSKSILGRTRDMGSSSSTPAPPEATRQEEQVQRSPSSRIHIKKEEDRRKDSFLGLSSASRTAMKATPKKKPKVNSHQPSSQVKPKMSIKQRVQNCFRFTEKQRYQKLLERLNIHETKEEEDSVGFSRKQDEDGHAYSAQLQTLAFFKRDSLGGSPFVGILTPDRITRYSLIDNGKKVTPDQSEGISISEYKSLVDTSHASSPVVSPKTQSEPSLDSSLLLQQRDRNRSKSLSLKRPLPVEEYLHPSFIQASSPAEDDEIEILSSTPAANFSNKVYRPSLSPSFHEFDGFGRRFGASSSKSLGHLHSFLSDYKRKKLRTESPPDLSFAKTRTSQKIKRRSNSSAKESFSSLPLSPPTDDDIKEERDLKPGVHETSPLIQSPNPFASPSSRSQVKRMSMTEKELPKKALEFSESFIKHKSYDMPSILDKMKDLDLNGHNKEAEEKEMIVCEARTARASFIEDWMKKSFNTSLGIPCKPFVPDFEPPLRQYLEEEEEEEEEEEQYVIEQDREIFTIPLQEIEAFIQDKLSSANESSVLIEMFDIPIKKKDLRTLDDSSWLNDEVINFYFNLIKKRSEEIDNFANVYVFNTFFYTKLVQGSDSFKMLRRWTRKQDIFSFDFILIPLNLGNAHWTLISINCRKKRVSYFDSMGGGLVNQKGENHQKAILEYLRLEHQDKKNCPLTDDWAINAKGVNDDDVDNFRIPQQENGSDCGVFVCKFAEYISRGAAFNFTQVHFPYFRKKMQYEILQGKLFW